jgi:hypothetical protein
MSDTKCEEQSPGAFRRKEMALHRAVVQCWCFVAPRSAPLQLQALVIAPSLSLRNLT